MATVLRCLSSVCEAALRLRPERRFGDIVHRLWVQVQSSSMRAGIALYEQDPP